MRYANKYTALVLAIAMVTCGCTTPSPKHRQASSSSSSVMTPSLAPFRPVLLEELDSDTADFSNASFQSCVSGWFSAYVASRVIEVTPGRTETTSFGPWTAEKEYGTTDAREDGSLTEWADNYYITHEWSPFGQQILSFVPGDTVTVNGHTVRIERIFNYPKQSFSDEIEEISGPGVVVFQTCYPNSDENRIAFGR